MSGALGHAREDRRQLQREHDAEIERLTEEMTRLTHQRNAAWTRENEIGRASCRERVSLSV